MGEELAGPPDAARHVVSPGGHARRLSSAGLPRPWARGPPPGERGRGRGGGSARRGPLTASRRGGDVDADLVDNFFVDFL
ncbi:unnamed protein product [Urochloa humidicola]